MKRPQRTSVSARQRRKRRLEDRELESAILQLEARGEREREIEAARAALRRQAEETEREVERGLLRAQAMRKSRRGRIGRRPRCTDKELDRLVAEAWRAGWQVERGGSGHIKVFVPLDGGTVITSVPMTPSKQRTWRRIRSTFRRAGLAV